MKKFFCLFAVIALLLPACNRKGTTRGASPAENSPVPDITVSSLNGTALKLSDLKGKVVLLNFWATWCPPCRDEIPSMMKLDKAMTGKPFQLVAVSIDEGGRSVVGSFFKSSGMNIPAYTDPDGSATKTYGITGVPETFIIDKQGVLAKKIIGPIEWDNPDVVSFLQNLMK